MKIVNKKQHYACFNEEEFKGFEAELQQVAREVLSVAIELKAGKLNLFHAANKLKNIARSIDHEAV